MKERRGRNGMRCMFSISGKKKEEDEDVAKKRGEDGD